MYKNLAADDCTNLNSNMKTNLALDLESVQLGNVTDAYDGTLPPRTYGT